MPSSKTPQMILSELNSKGAIVRARLKSQNKFQPVLYWENEMQEDLAKMNDWLRSSMQSLLLHVKGEMPRRDIIVCPASTPDDEQHWPEDCNCSIDLVYNSAITDCLAVIQSTIDSIKE